MKTGLTEQLERASIYYYKKITQEDLDKFLENHFQHMNKIRGVKALIPMHDELHWILKKEWDLYYKFQKEQESKLPNQGNLIYGTK